MEARTGRIDRESYPECVRKAADHLTKMFEDGSVFPARMRFDSAGEVVEESQSSPAGSFAFFIPDVQGVSAGERDEQWPWIIYATHAHEAFRAQVGDWGN